MQTNLSDSKLQTPNLKNFGSIYKFVNEITVCAWIGEPCIFSIIFILNLKYLYLY